MFIFKLIYLSLQLFALARASSSHFHSEPISTPKNDETNDIKIIKLVAHVSQTNMSSAFSTWSKFVTSEKSERQRIVYFQRACKNADKHYEAMKLRMCFIFWFRLMRDAKVMKTCEGYGAHLLKPPQGNLVFYQIDLIKHAFSKLKESTRFDLEVARLHKQGSFKKWRDYVLLKNFVRAAEKHHKMRLIAGAFANWYSEVFEKVGCTLHDARMDAILRMKFNLEFKAFGRWLQWVVERRMEK